eukprot:m.340124 g.340124  ORF g.340124 m.340124 type:complete len:65 (+) comp19148_c0_seq1:695-889(+)
MATNNINMLAFGEMSRKKRKMSKWSKLLCTNGLCSCDVTNNNYKKRQEKNDEREIALVLTLIVY